MNILDAMKANNGFGKHFRGSTWDACRVFLCALFALPMTPEQLAIFQKHTGRSAPSTGPLHEAWLVCGRRSGKSFMLACIAVFLAAFRDWRPFLGPGEVATIMIIAADRRQARVIMRYCLGLLRAVPMLKQLIEGQTAESITLRNRVVIEVHTASFRSTRGYSLIAARLLAIGGISRARRGDLGRDQARHEHDTGGNAALRVVTICTSGRAVGRTPQAFRQGC